MSDKKPPVWVDDEGESGQGEVTGQVEESWTHILEGLGVDTRAMSYAEIQAVIRNYSEQNSSSGKVYDMTGKEISSVPKKDKNATYRTYTVAEDQSGPVAPENVVQNKLDKRSEKELKNTPASTPAKGPSTPKGPGI